LKKQAKEAEELVVGVQRESSQEKKERWWSGAMDIFKDKNRQFIHSRKAVIWVSMR
jgi:hypothetical protein